MNVLFICAVYPFPLFSGGQIRLYQLLRRLGKKHRIDVFTFLRDAEKIKPDRDLPFVHSVTSSHRGGAFQLRYLVKTLLSSKPLLLESYNNARLRHAIERVMRTTQYDLIHIEPGYVFPVVPQKSTAPLVVAEHNVEHTIYERYARSFSIPFLRGILRYDVGKLAHWERVTWKSASQVISVSDEDRNMIAKECPQTPVSVIPNGVDLPTFPFVPRSADLDKPEFLFVGNFSWVQNRDAADVLMSTIWPHIRQRIAHASLRIVGKGVEAFAAHKSLAPGISIHESVPDIAQEYARSHILLAPIRIGGGTKFKILEAMASGLPVVTTPLGAAGFGKDTDSMVAIASIEDFSDAAVRLVRDAHAYATFAKTARARVEASYSWDAIAQSLDGVWQRAAARRSV